MAVSGMEQRNMPLVTSMSFWKPWGPGRLTPGNYPDSDDYGDMEEVEQVIVPKRRNSWAGYTSYMQADFAATTNTGFLMELPQNPDKERRTSTSESHISSDAEAIAAGIDDVKSEPATIDALKHGLDCSIAAEQSQANAILPKSKRLTSKKKHSHSTTAALDGGKQLPDSFDSLESKCSPGGGPPPGGGGTPGPIGTVTTLMIRNLPYWLTQAELIAEVDRCGFAGLYDFCYLPHKFAKRKNLGFAFLNFDSTEHATQFWQEWHHSRRFGTSALNVSAAAVQGREDNIKKAASQKFSLVRNPGFRPVVFSN